MPPTCPSPRLLLSFCCISALAFTKAPSLAVAMVARPSEEAAREWGPAAETVAARPAAKAGRETTERPALMATRRPLWQPEIPEEMIMGPLPLPLPPLRRRTTKRPPVVATNGTASEDVFAAGDVDGGWPQEGSTYRTTATIPPTTTVEAVPLYVIDAPERSQAVTTNCAPGQRWLNNRCRTVTGGR